MMDRSTNKGSLGQVLLAVVAFFAAWTAHDCFVPAQGSAVNPFQPALSVRGLQAVPEPVAQELVAVMDEATFAGGDELEVVTLPLHAPGAGLREVNVLMFNKHSGRGDRSEGFSLRKKFRKCSTLARLATKKGRKIHKRRLHAGRKRGTNPGDYINPKMQPLVKLVR
mmetsp:Transcript_67541/g.162149  ORF Transcript_67541/g.162149 Transcript_67541/m.162149 type:complete len:167 (+) Transcript_67541:82-582(+)